MDLNTLNQIKKQADDLRREADTASLDAEAFKKGHNEGEPFIKIHRHTEYQTSRETAFSKRRREVLEPILAPLIPHLLCLAELELRNRSNRLRMEADVIEATIKASILDPYPPASPRPTGDQP